MMVESKSYGTHYCVPYTWNKRLPTSSRALTESYLLVRYDTVKKNKITPGKFSTPLSLYP